MGIGVAGLGHRRRAVALSLGAALGAIALTAPAAGAAGGHRGREETTSVATRTSPPTVVRFWSKRYTGYLQTADGAQLHYSVLLPRRRAFPQDHGRYPVILNYSGYDPGSIGGRAYKHGETAMSVALDRSLVEAGYAVLGVNMPGTGCSSGPLRFFEGAWGTDGAEAVQWAAHQGWSDGNVGMANWSFAGLSQLYVAEQNPANLRAIAPGMVVADPTRDVSHPGGLENTLFPAAWWLYIKAQWYFASETAQAEGDSACLANLAGHLQEGETENPSALTRAHPFADVFDEAQGTWRDAAKIHVPVFSVEDWQDEATGTRGGYYQAALNPATTYYLGTNGRHDIYVSRLFREKLISFFDRYVKGEQNGFERGPHVWLWQDTTSPESPLPEDAGMELAEPGWVITQAALPLSVQPVRLALRSGGVLGDVPASAAEGADSFTYPTLGPAVNADLGPGESEWEASTPTPSRTPEYATAPLARDFTFAGPASADLWVSTTGADADLQVTLTEVRPDGTEVYVQRGWLRLYERAVDPLLSSELEPFHQQSEAGSQPMQAGVPQLARVEIQKFSHTFRKGSSIRMWIDSPSMTGEWDFKALDGAAGAVSVLHDAIHPSSLVLGLLASEAPPIPPRACGALIAEPCRPATVPVPEGSETLGH